jgi:hypothetical protein
VQAGTSSVLEWISDGVSCYGCFVRCTALACTSDERSNGVKMCDDAVTNRRDDLLQCTSSHCPKRRPEIAGSGTRHGLQMLWNVGGGYGVVEEHGHHEPCETAEDHEAAQNLRCKHRACSGGTNGAEHDANRYWEA